MRQIDAWAAGFLDGEGCFTIKRGKGLNGRSPRHYINVDASQTDIRPLKRLEATYGGRTYVHLHNQNPNASPAWRWKIQGAKAAAMIRMIRPLLVVKDQQADALLELQAMLRTNNQSRVRITWEDIVSRDEVTGRIRFLNRRGKAQFRQGRTNDHD